MKGRNGVRIAISVIGCMVAGMSLARTITREEALRLAYPGANIQSTMIFLTEAQVKEASARAGNPLRTPLMARYTAVNNGAVVGRAYLDSHIVRTKKESLLILLNADGTVKRVEVVAFEEPPEYQPIQKWYDQFQGKSLSPELSLKDQIRPVTGASLTSRSTVDAVRRVLAIDSILQEKDPKKE